MNKTNNLFADLPGAVPEEIFEDLVVAKNIRIERIISDGHSSPEEGWYDQEENEWVLVLVGYGILEFEDGSEIVLNPGDYYTIIAHEKHKVKATSDQEKTIWLTVFYS
ncbi:cupin domain-containing protein [Vibrio salinus]|uniref:cupin domain-containing protein n=1 Tax=Vibrio salinus TaxID=2899784 RepID=UPI001E63ED8A|nr:cupin domain-containing protein [Vibrio salinus]MCE0495391.1 cupin domain-containing protein [Vibrio salinus]